MYIQHIPQTLHGRGMQGHTVKKVENSRTHMIEHTQMQGFNKGKSLQEIWGFSTKVGCWSGKKRMSQNTTKVVTCSNEVYTNNNMYDHQCEECVCCFGVLVSSTQTTIVILAGNDFCIVLTLIFHFSFKAVCENPEQKNNNNQNIWVAFFKM